MTSDASKRVETDLELIWQSTGKPVYFLGILLLPAVVFPDWGPFRHGRTGTQLAPGPTQMCVSPSEPGCTDIVHSQGGQRTGLASCAKLAHLDLLLRTHASCDSPFLDEFPLGKKLVPGFQVGPPATTLNYLLKWPGNSPILIGLLWKYQRYLGISNATPSVSKLTKSCSFHQGTDVTIVTKMFPTAHFMWSFR